MIISGNKNSNTTVSTFGELLKVAVVQQFNVQVTLSLQNKKNVAQ